MKTLFFQDNKKILFLIIISIFSLIFALKLSLKSCLLKNEWCGQDMDQYIDYSNNLLTGHGFSSKSVSNMYFIDPQKNKEYIPEIQRLPSYPVAISLLRLIYNKPIIILIINYLFYIFILFYFYKISTLLNLGIYTISIFAFLAFSPSLLYYLTQGGNVDIFATFLISSFSYYILRIYEDFNVSIKSISIVAFITPIALLVRQNTALYIFPLIIVLLVSLYAKKRMKAVKMVALILIIAVITVSSWILRNYMLVKKPVFSAASGMQLFAEYIIFSPYQNNTTYNLKEWFYAGEGGKLFIEKKTNAGQTIVQAYVGFDEFITNIVYTYLFLHPINFINHYVYAVKSIFTAKSFSFEQKNLFNYLSIIQDGISNIYMYLFLLYPLLIINIVKKSFLLFSLWVSTLTYILISAFYHGVVIGSRGSLPVLPVILIVSGLTIKDLIDFINTKIKGKYEK